MQECTFKPKVNPKTPPKMNYQNLRRKDTLQLNDSPITLVSASPPLTKKNHIIEAITKPLLLQTTYISNQSQILMPSLIKKEENKQFKMSDRSKQLLEQRAKRLNDQQSQQLSQSPKPSKNIEKQENLVKIA